MNTSMPKRISLNFILALGLTLSALIVVPGCTYFAAGSYPFVEKYTIDTSEDAVIKAVNTFKAQHPAFIAPEYLKDGRSDSSDHWYHIYFYLPEERVIVYCWTRPETKKQTAFAFVGINEGTGLGNWKDINKDFSSSENERLLKIFETRLLKPVKLILYNKSTYNK